MKKLLAKITAVAAAVASAMPLYACNDDNDGTYKIYMPDGAPAIALSALMDSGYSGADFTVVRSEDIAALVSNGSADFAILPVNQAAKLYNGGVDIVMLSVNTHGNLYIVGGQGDGDTMDLADLKGKTLGMIGQGNVPDLTLRMLLIENNVPFEASKTAVSGKIAVSYYSDASELLPLFKAGELDYALLGEPAATNSGGNLAINIQDRWLTSFDAQYPQACLVVKGSVIDNDKKFVDKFLKDLTDSDGWAKTNPQKAQKAIADNVKKGMQTSLKALSADIVERCNIKTVAAEDCRDACNAYFDKLVGMKDHGITVLDKAPDLDFYYKP